MSKIIGIDLGTTYSAIAQLDDLGTPEVLASTDNNKKITVSSVYIKDQNMIMMCQAQQPKIQSGLIEVMLIHEQNLKEDINYIKQR